ncbi:MAG: hypothetical protein ABL977_13600 [Candidatus Eisenbacteria bacterium]
MVGRLCLGSVNGVYAVPVSDGAGGAFIVWIESAGQDCDLRIQHVSASGEPAAGWPQEGQPLCVAMGTQTQPAVHVTGAGSVIVAWKDYRDPQRVAVYLRRVQAGPPGTVGDGSDETLISDSLASDPRLCSDGASGAWLLWLQGASSVRELRVQHLLADASPDPAWPASGRLIATGPGEVEDPSVSVDGTGGFFATWKSREESARSLRLQRIDSDGSPSAGWPIGGVAVTVSDAPVTVGAIAADSAGVAIVWGSATDDSAQARIAWFSPVGSPRPGWQVDGRRLSGPGVESTDPAMAAGPAGSRFVSWVAYDSLMTTGVVKLSRFASSGATWPGWPEDGVAVAASAMEKHDPRLLVSPEGVLVSWSESDDRGQGAVIASASALHGSAPRLAAVDRWPDLVKIVWSVPARPEYQVIPERQGLDGIWLPLPILRPDAAGRLSLSDPEVQAGELLRYRLRLRTPTIDAVEPEIEVRVPATAPLALRGLNAKGGALRLFFSVPARAAARFELFDVQGRRLLFKELLPEHAGESSMEWPTPEGVRGGVYFARLRQSGVTKNQRYVLAR